MLEQAGFPVSGLLATHADWDHLLGRLAFGGAALGCGESTAQRLTAEPGAAQRELRAFDDEHYVERGPLSLGGAARRCRSRASSDSGAASTSSSFTRPTATRSTASRS